MLEEELKVKKDTGINLGMNGAVLCRNLRICRLSRKAKLTEFTQERTRRKPSIARQYLPDERS